jgi:hypothetical protein
MKARLDKIVGLDPVLSLVQIATTVATFPHVMKIFGQKVLMEP